MKSDKYYPDETLCVAKITPVSSTQCDIEMFFDGGRSVKKFPVKIDEPAHIKKERHEFDDGHVVIERQVQVGEGGLVPFVKQLEEMYPNVMIVEAQHFDTMVEAQKQAAGMLVDEQD